ncbi:peptidase M15 [Verrucomicrobia bacterium LW23]|nr:peptidase M15 [Verrucomicrobia bacterium LW23]
MSEHTFDARSESNLKTLLPAAQVKAREWLRRCLDAGINLKIICGTRTWEEQEALYEQGRSKPGKVVTNARAGYSYHNFGIAWDFVVFSSDFTVALWNSPDMARAGRIAEAMGLEWGGSWKGFVDTPHVQINTGLTLAQMRERHRKGERIL